MTYLFPAIKTDNDPFSQFSKILEEVFEVSECLANNELERAYEETLDVIQSCETLCRILSTKTNLNHEDMLQYVISKNSERDYYDHW